MSDKEESTENVANYNGCEVEYPAGINNPSNHTKSIEDLVRQYQVVTVFNYPPTDRESKSPVSMHVLFHNFIQSEFKL